ncbi:MAG: isoprenylcysteine carboxylmethyltransferase family protein [Hyphomicrobiaceae bacterium]
MREPTTDRPSPFPWPPVLLAGAIAAALVLHHYVLALPVPFAELGSVHYIGMLVLLAGIGLVLWAMLQFPRHRTSIRPDRGADALVLAGPFAFSRNPIYLGEALALVGAGVAYNMAWLVLVVPVFVGLVTHLAIVREEAYLERRFANHLPGLQGTCALLVVSIVQKGLPEGLLIIDLPEFATMSDVRVEE